MLRLKAVAAGVRGLRCGAAVSSGHAVGDVWWGWERANGREYVGFGIDGSPNYFDRLDFPYPAIRFRKDDEAILKLREKEKGDWKNLTLEEKKLLYRASFKETYAEFDAPDGHWKLVLSLVCVCLTFSLWLLWFQQQFIHTSLPRTLDDDWKEGNLQRMIEIHSEPISGVASKWDYEKERWKA